MRTPCTYCQAPQEFPDSLAGTTVECKSCGMSFPLSRTVPKIERPPPREEEEPPGWKPTSAPDLPEPKQLDPWRGLFGCLAIFGMVVAFFCIVILFGPAGDDTVFRVLGWSLLFVLIAVVGLSTRYGH